MCGICGFVYFDNRPVDRALLQRMADSMRHRGPDQSGEYAGVGAGLGHRRLSIIDVSSGRQPLSNEDGTIWISFNGEIYNYLDLSRELQETHSFRTRSDTETIVHLYESRPRDFIRQLRGMFAFAIWDERDRAMILARDRVGKKPLYYYLDNEKLVFASEIKSILLHPDLRIEIDDEAVCDYLSFGYVPAPKSIFNRIRKVRPGHYLRVAGGRVEEFEYWDLSFAETNGLSDEEWKSRIMERLAEAVRIRLMSEVPLGAFLSGGIDSSAVVALMSRSMPDPVKTSTIGFLEDRYDESDYAREVAKYLQTDHYERKVTPDKIEVIEKLAWHYDEPFADSSALPTYYVSQVAREKVTVALSGDGGDENFAGYRRYVFDMRENRLRSLLPLGARRAVFGPLARFYPKLDWAPRVVRGKSTFQSLSMDALQGYFESMSTFRSHEKGDILSRDFKARLAGYRSIEVFRRHFEKAGTADPLSRIQYLDIKTYLTDDILTKVDRASMAHSLEVRCPLLDHKFMELVATIPSRLKLRRGSGKYIFKRALEPYLPRDTIYRRKMGFGIPLAEWFRTGIRDYAQDYILGAGDPYLNNDFVRKIWNQHQSRARDRSSQLWNVLMFRLWHSKFAR